MVTGLPLTALIPPTLVAVDPVDLIAKVWSDRRVPRQEPTVAAGHRLSRAPELLSPEGPFWWGPVSSFGSNVVRPRRSTGRSRGTGPRWRPCSYARLGGWPPSVLVGALPSAAALAYSSTLSLPVTGRGPVVCGDPAGDDLVVSAQDTAQGTNLHDGDGESPSRAHGAHSCSVYGGRGVHKNSVPVAALLSLVEDVQSPVNGVGLRAKGLRAKGLRVKDLLVRAKMAALAGPPPGDLPHASCSHLIAVKA